MSNYFKRRNRSIGVSIDMEPIITLTEEELENVDEVVVLKKMLLNKEMENHRLRKENLELKRDLGISRRKYIKVSNKIAGGF